jgi:hypothetical protein
MDRTLGSDLTGVLIFEKSILVTSETHILEFEN